MEAFDILFLVSGIVFATTVIIFLLYVDICESAERRRREREENDEHW